MRSMFLRRLVHQKRLVVDVEPTSSWMSLADLAAGCLRGAGNKGNESHPEDARYLG